MERLTTNKDVSDIEGMYELAHNSCYIDKDGNARYRDFETDIDSRILTRQLLKKYAEGDDAFTCDEDFDEEMVELLQYGTETLEGLIALFYRNLWVMADLREHLKSYEDAEEQGLLLRLPCKVGDTVYWINGKFIMESEVESFAIDEDGVSFAHIRYLHDKEHNRYYGHNLDIDKLGITWFLTIEEAEYELAKDKLAEEVESIGYLNKAEAKRMIEQALAGKKEV